MLAIYSAAGPIWWPFLVFIANRNNLFPFHIIMTRDMCYGSASNHLCNILQFAYRVGQKAFIMLTFLKMQAGWSIALCKFSMH